MDLLSNEKIYLVDCLHDKIKHLQGKLKEAYDQFYSIENDDYEEYDEFDLKEDIIRIMNQIKWIKGLKAKIEQKRMYAFLKKD